jgi:hypothetical protein
MRIGLLPPSGTFPTKTSLVLNREYLVKLLQYFFCLSIIKLSYNDIELPRPLGHGIIYDLFQRNGYAKSHGY